MANIELIRGDDTDIGVIITDDTAPIAPERISRVDLHAKAQGKIALRLSSTDGSIELGDGELVLHFDRYMTAGATWQQAAYDLQAIIDDKVKTVLRGTITLTHDITEVALD